ncbi:MAG: hypothetical protein JWM22_2547 [Frankiales bacterium]|jgi:hypothetical protein|nr:hypothetical protein [Frankiales bacterium]
MTNLLEVPPEWVTLRAMTPEGQPVVVLVDRAIATTVPYEVFTLQVAIAVQLGETRDGLPAETDKANLRTLEQGMVDLAAGEARLVAVMTLEGVREWVFYARTTEWCKPFVEAGLSVRYAEDPTFSGLLELAGG